MRILYVAAGAGGAYCGACARDVTLARGLIERGHDALLLPLYTPLTADQPGPGGERVFYGGISAWLEQHSALFRRAPAALDWLLDRPWLLRLASKNAIETRPERLGAMTVSVLRGRDGRQAKELDKLLRFVEANPRPDVVNLTNSLLAALAPAVKERLGVPVVCTLQGEEVFVERLGDPYRQEAKGLLRQHAAAFDLLIAPSAAYAGEMARFLDVPPERVRVVRPGLDLTVFKPGEPAAAPAFRVGFLSRLSPVKGLDLLCEAFGLLAARRAEPMTLAVAGQSSRAGRRFWKRLRGDLARSGHGDRVEFVGEVDLAGKVRFLQGLSAFAVPSRTPERRAMAALEALACGVPAVLPRRNAYDEILELTGGGVLVEPDDAEALAAGIERLLDDRAGAAGLGAAAAQGVARHFSAALMVDQTLQVYQEVLKRSG